MPIIRYSIETIVVIAVRIHLSFIKLTVKNKQKYKDCLWLHIRQYFAMTLFSYATKTAIKVSYQKNLHGVMRQRSPWIIPHLIVYRRTQNHSFRIQNNNIASVLTSITRRCSQIPICDYGIIRIDMLTIGCRR